MSDEIWKDIEGYGGFYQVSNKGRIRSWHKKGPGHGKSDTPKHLKKSVNNLGYEIVDLYKYGEGKIKSVHRLVAIAFIPNPKNKGQINHKDGNKSNNTVTNLEWCTCSDNHLHAYKNRLRDTMSENHHLTSFSNNDVRTIRKLYSTGEYTQNEIADMFDTTQSTISAIITKRNWKHAT